MIQRINMHYWEGEAQRLADPGPIAQQVGYRWTVRDETAEEKMLRRERREELRVRFERTVKRHLEEIAEGIVELERERAAVERAAEIVRPWIDRPRAQIAAELARVEETGGSSEGEIVAAHIEQAMHARRAAKRAAPAKDNRP